MRFDDDLHEDAISLYAGVHLDRPTARSTRRR